MKKTKDEVMLETESLLADDAAIIDIYEKVLNGELKKFPKYTWELPNSMYYAKVIVRYLFEIKLKWSIEDVKQKFDGGTISKYRLRGMFQALFNSHFELIDHLYPKQIYPWELKKVPRYFWESDENKREALRWLFLDKLGGDVNEIKKILSHHTFREYRLQGLFLLFDNSPFKTFDFIFPNEIKPWELEVCPMGYWESEDNKRLALKWLFEEIFNGNLTLIKQELSDDTFKQYDLKGLLMYFGRSPYKALDFYYPGKVKPWQLSRVPVNFWLSEENKKDALLWLFNDILRWTDVQIDELLTVKHFYDNDLVGLLGYFDNSPYLACHFLYPEKSFPNLYKRSRLHHKVV